MSDKVTIDSLAALAGEPATRGPLHDRLIAPNGAQPEPDHGRPDPGVVNLLATAQDAANTLLRRPAITAREPFAFPKWPTTETISEIPPTQPTSAPTEAPRALNNPDAGAANLLAIANVAAALPRTAGAVAKPQPIELPIWPRTETSPVPTIEPVTGPAIRTAEPISKTVTITASQPVVVETQIPADTPSWPKRLLRYAGYAIAGYAAFLPALVVLFRFVNPPGSALMAWRAIGGTDINRAWVPISQISPNLVRAVVVAEDWTFCAHHGVDVAAMQEAIEKAGDGIPRGASTISMQTVKNVFLWPSKSYIRKAVELPLTLVMELVWPKRRVLEVYLNIAEWGPGIFGAEAAARHHFNKPASKLTSREAAQLAASLPNPFVRDAGDPGPRLARKATTIQNRMRVAGGVTDCVGVASDAKAP